MIKVVEFSRGVKVGFQKDGLTVIGHLFRFGGRGYGAVCECECGRIAFAQVNSLLSGGTVSCGCRRAKHGASHKKLYYIWRAMRSRCYLPADGNYKRYGARGITVCDEWRESYTAFEKWAMANGYKDGLSIDRKKNQQPYCPENCQWITRASNSSKKAADHVYDGSTAVPVDVILAIREESAAGSSRAVLVAKYGLTADTVSGIVTGKTYKTVGGPLTHGQHPKLNIQKTLTIIEARSRGVSNAEVAKMVGISEVLVSRVFCRDRRLPAYVLAILDDIDRQQLQATPASDCAR